MKRSRLLIIVLLSTVLLTGLPQKGLSEVTKDYFKGKTITFLVPFNPGGGYDTYARLMVPYIKKYLPVENVIVKNEPAGGGLAAANILARSKPDGKTIMILQATAAILSELAEVRGIRYKSDQYTWLCRLTSSPVILVSSPKSAFKTIDDFKAAQKEIIIAGIGRDFSSMASRAVFEAFGIPYRTVMGYEVSSEMVLAIIRGDADTSAFSYESLKPTLDAKEIHGILMLGEKASGVQIPLASTEAERLNIPDNKKALLNSLSKLLELYRSVAASPGISPALSKVMRDAFEKAINDPEFLSTAKRMNKPVDPLNGIETQKMVQDAVNGLRKDPESIKMIKSLF